MLSIINIPLSIAIYYKENVKLENLTDVDDLYIGYDTTTSGTFLAVAIMNSVLIIIVMYQNDEYVAFRQLVRIVYFEFFSFWYHTLVRMPYSFITSCMTTRNNNKKKYKSNVNSSNSINTNATTNNSNDNNNNSNNSSNNNSNNNDDSNNNDNNNNNPIVGSKV